MSAGDDLAREVFQATDEALLAAAHEIAAQAKRNMPVGDPAEDPNMAVALRESVEVDAHVGNLVTVSVNTPYAATQEFDLHKRHLRGGGARYLARAVAEVAPHLEGLIAGRVRGHTKRGTITRD